MKKTSIYLLPALFLLAAITLSSCKKDKCLQTRTYKTYTPVYMSYEEMRSSVRSEDPQPLQNPGKIYLKGNYIFVNEINKGIHVIDNSNPYAPQNISFINIPGNVDIAAVGNVLYADSYVDLVVLNISNPVQITVLNRLENALPYPAYEYGYSADASLGVVKDWKELMKTDTLGEDCNATGGGWWVGGPFEGDVMTANGVVSIPKTSQSPGIGGSTARFTIASNALYIVDHNNLHVYDITATSAPSKVSDKNVGWSIETIFPYKNHLFIGSNSGVYIYDNSNPLSPNYVSTYDHITACDPVVVDDDYAYFTLSNDAPCHMGVNQLEVVDISNIAQPTLKITMPMVNPKGLGIDNKKLFICDSQDGLKVYDANDIMNISQHQLAHFGNMKATDVIPWNNRLLMIGSDGLTQYDYSNINNISVMSVIPVAKP